ncbi:MAG: ATP-binding protein [Bacteroidota bacterium]
MEVALPPAPLHDPLPLVAADLLSATLDEKGRLVHANSAWTAAFGSDGVWDRMSPDDARLAREYATEARRGQLVSHQVFLLPSDDSTPTPVLLHFHPVRLGGPSGSYYPVLLTGEVLREPVSWAQEQTRRRRMEVVGQMAMGMAHDFNNLLTTILGHVELLRGGLSRTLDSTLSESVSAVTRAARDGAALVKKIQAYLRHEKREAVEPIDLAALVEEVVTLTRPYWYNEPRRQGIAIELLADLAPVPTIEGYPTELREVLVNLMLNAVQAMPAGGSISITTFRDADRRAAVVEVADSGVGIPDRVLKRIFEPLYTTKGANGTGMGLAVAQGIIAEHDGRIEVESEPGQGSIFRLVLPFGVETTTVMPRSRRPAPGPLPSTTTGLRLLVVDDEPMVRTITARLLGLRGHEVTAVHGGMEALGALDAASFDCVVTDLSMPEMNGRELAARIHERKGTLPVVLLTGDTDPEVDSGTVAAVVRKPFDADALDHVVRGLV